MSNDQIPAWAAKEIAKQKIAMDELNERLSGIEISRAENKSSDERSGGISDEMRDYLDENK